MLRHSDPNGKFTSYLPLLKSTKNYFGSLLQGWTTTSSHVDFLDPSTRHPGSTINQSIQSLPSGSRTEIVLPLSMSRAGGFVPVYLQGARGSVSWRGFLVGALRDWRDVNPSLSCSFLN